jgi:hypothetical protein
MRKIIQILYDHTQKSQRPLWLVLCDDGTVWRQIMVPNPLIPTTGGLMLVDPTYHTEWERAVEFDGLPENVIDAKGDLWIKQPRFSAEEGPEKCQP